jgi:microcystin-dependent protein
MIKAISILIAFLCASPAWSGSTNRQVQGDELILSQITTPANPSSGRMKFYMKSGKLYYLDSTGTEKQIGLITDLDSTGGGNGQVPTANGSGGTTWQTPLSGHATGEVFPTAGTTCPTGSIAADGSSILRSGGTSCGGASCATLFAAISTTYGSADGTHFTLPNLQGVFPRGAGSQTVAGVTYTGTQGTTQGDAMQDHNHVMSLNVGSNMNSWGYDGSWSTVGGSGSGTSSAGHTSPASSVSGQRTASETRPANVTLLYCIKY